MPELPEVETIRGQLRKLVPFTILNEKYSDKIGSIIKNDKPQVADLTIVDIMRKGKFLNFHFADNTHLINHLGMSGSWIINKKPSEEKHTHVEFHICVKKDLKKYYLSYVDPRRFGKMYYCSLPHFKKRWGAIGPDITSQEFTLEYLGELIKKYPNKKIKDLLMNQKLLSGVGNYMASEICAWAKIRPQKRCSLISKKYWPKIYESILFVAGGAIKSGGTTFSGGYRDTTGKKGEGLKNLIVFYQRVCGQCKSEPVKKVYLSGRGTYYCPFCQK